MINLDFICCPSCSGKLKNHTEMLSCISCGATYDCVESVPVFLPDKNISNHLQHQIDYFEEYSRSENYLSEWQKSYVDRLLENIKIHQDMVVLDCGAGSGYMTIELAKRGCFVIATDLTLKSMVRLNNIANKLGLGDRIMCICSVAEILPTPENCIDVYISNAVLEHVIEEEKAINEIARVVKKQGFVMVAVPLAYKYINPILLLPNIIHDKHIGHLRRYTKEILKDRFLAVNISIFGTYYTGHTSKVLKVLINSIYHVFDEKLIEIKDRKKENEKIFASNIICFFKKI